MLPRLKRWLMPLDIPLAWRQLASERLRLLAAAAGIAFAVVMMLMQLGFYDALYRSSTVLHSSLRGDLVMVSTQFESVITGKPFTRRRLEQARALEEVMAVAPVFIGNTFWKNPETRQDRDIFVIGVDPSHEAIRIPAVDASLELTRNEGVVLFDAKSREEFGPIAATLAQNQPVRTEVAGKRVMVGGLFEMGTSFAADGNLITSERNFLRLFPHRQPGMIDIGSIELKPAANVEAVRRELESFLPRDIRVVTKADFIKMERDYWGRRTPIGFVITAGVIVGFIVGSVIVYQILYTDVLDHLKEYATLKAIGHTDAALVAIVLQEAVILSVIGFLPGCLGSVLIFHLTRDITLLPAYLTLDKALLVFGLTVAMCCASGALAMRKLRSADPAEIF